MNAEEAKGYWESRWLQQGKATVGHHGDDQAAFEQQTRAYGTALQTALRMPRPGGGGRYERLLDYGCGWGRMFPYLAQVCEDYLGVDHSQEAVTMAEEAHPFGAFEQIPLRRTLAWADPDQFDAVVTCTVLQHIVDPAVLVRTVSMLERVLQPGGRMVLIENISTMDNKPHIHYRTVTEYMDLFTSNMGWRWQDSVVHNDERHAILVGDKLS